MTILRSEQSNPVYSRPNTQTLTLNSSYLNRRQDVTIYNPYSDAKDLPVILLLHGVYGNNWVWMDLGGVHLVYEQLRRQGLSEFVLVMPSDGGIWEGSAYLPLGRSGDFEKWIIDDVLSAVQDTVSSVSAESNLYITGLSMGGYGALRLGCKYAHMFKGISAHSSITKISDMAHFTQQDLNSYQTANINESDILYWCQQNKEQLPPLRLDCGKQDPLFNSNQDFSNTLCEASIKHQFDIYEGDHDWVYWHQHIATTMKFFDAIEHESKRNY